MDDRVKKVLLVLLFLVMAYFALKDNATIHTYTNKWFGSSGQATATKQEEVPEQEQQQQMEEPKKEQTQQDKDREVKSGDNPDDAARRYMTEPQSKRGPY